jgi:hypothetical protein
MDESQYSALTGLLNSSVAAFWMRQVFHDKGGGGIGGGIAAETWERFLAFDGSKLKHCPLPAGRPLALARQLDALARELAEQTPGQLLARSQEDLTQRRKDAKGILGGLASLREMYSALRRRMIALQEDLDWQCYRLYGLIDEDLCDSAPLHELSLGQRAFEIVLARKIRDEGL